MSPPSRKVLACSALGVLVVSGLVIQPRTSVYRWNVGAFADGPSTPENALAAARDYHQRHRPFVLDALVVSYEVESKEKWDARATIGCNDSWIVKHRSLFGVVVSRAAYLCDGFTAKWL